MLEPSDLARYRRETLAMLNKGLQDDPDGLAAVYDILTKALSDMGDLVVAQMRRDGYSWADIGRAFHMNRETAYRRFTGGALTSARLQHIDDLAKGHR